MIQLTTTIDQKELDQLIRALRMVGQHQLPGMARAVQAATLAVQQEWVDKAKGVFDRPTKKYMGGILEGHIYPMNNDPYSGAIINTQPHAKYIEYGTRPHDMKKALYTSSQVRVSKKGKRYLIIPFRHGTPSKGSHEGGSGTKRAMMNTMPESVYNKAKNMAFSHRTGGYIAKNRYTDKAYRNRYQWGGRLTQHQVKEAGAGAKLKQHHKTNIYAGMVKFRRDEGTNTSQYMTFRIMHEDSTGWWHPGTPPLHLAQKTANEMRPIVERLIQNGFNEDLRKYGLA